MPGGAGFVVSYWRGSLTAERTATDTMVHLHDEREKLAEAVVDQLAEARRYELLLEENDRRDALGADRQERLAIEDAVVARRAVLDRR